MAAEAWAAVYLALRKINKFVTDSDENIVKIYHISSVRSPVGTAISLATDYIRPISRLPFTEHRVNKTHDGAVQCETNELPLRRIRSDP